MTLFCNAINIYASVSMSVIACGCLSVSSSNELMFTIICIRRKIKLIVLYCILLYCLCLTVGVCMIVFPYAMYIN